MSNQFKITITANKDTKINFVRQSNVFLNKNEKKAFKSDCVGSRTAA